MVCPFRRVRRPYSLRPRRPPGSCGRHQGNPLHAPGTNLLMTPPHLPRGRIGVMLPRDLPAAHVLPYARRAEELGFDELWVVEDLGFRGGVAQAGAVLAATERIVVGIGIMPAGARNVAFAAMEIATLAQLFPGRLI